MSLRRLAFLVSMSLSVLGCSAPHRARPPVLTAGADPARTYADYKLVDRPSFWAPKWSRADGTYSYEELDEALEVYPSTRALKRRASVRAGVLAGIGGAGGGLAGFTLGYNLGAPERLRWSTEAQAGMYAAGGGLILTAIVMGLVWRNPVLDLSSVYNEELRRQLGQPGEPPRPSGHLDGVDLRGGAEVALSGPSLLFDF